MRSFAAILKSRVAAKVHKKRKENAKKETSLLGFSTVSNPSNNIRPQLPVRRLFSPLRRFLQIESASGCILLVCAAIAIIIANSPWAAAYHRFWQTHLIVGIDQFVLNKPLEFWVNDGLMAIFFFVVGLEIKREIVNGELSEWRKASLPVLGAVGGMVAPALVYSSFQLFGAHPRGWGVPMATDIAFVVGIMALFGSRVPPGLKVFLLALAIADDIGAVLVIAVAYTDQLSLDWLWIGLATLALIAGMNRLGVRSVVWYVGVSIVVWLAFLAAHIHPTVAGVILGLMTPAQPLIRLSGLRDTLRDNLDRLPSHEAETGIQQALVEEIAWTASESVSPLARLEHVLHPIVGFIIMPIFALANAGVAIDLGRLTHPISLGIAAGLFIGKPLGIVAFAWLAIKLGLAKLPNGSDWKQVLAAGFLGGIGFTMAIFIASLAFAENHLPDLLAAAKVGVLLGTVASAIVGAALLAWATRGK